MPLSWNEIRDRALAFSREWADEYSEDAEAKSFWDGFFNVFGITRRRVASFEAPVKRDTGALSLSLSQGEKENNSPLDSGGQKASTGYIDLLWKGVLLVEHKSKGKDLDRAARQAFDYFPGLKERDLPRYVLVSDFARFRLYDLDNSEQHDFPLADLSKNIKLFGFIAGYQTRSFGQQDPVNVQAAEKLGRLHDQFKATGYEGHPLEVLLVRLLFCLYAEDTALFERRAFQDYLEQRTLDDGSDLGMHLAQLFQTLDTPPEKRLKTLDEQLAAFPYVNGQLFAESLPITACDRAMRESLLDCCALDWSRISPAIFGSLFQSIMDTAARRNLGAHYTSETNILKLIQPLFLDDLWAEFEKCKRNRNQLFDFLKKLSTLQFFDPACGCGNFLVIAYRELRTLELAVLRQVRQHDQLMLDVFQLIGVNVDQFHGIEIEEWPARIAEVALWLTDHQMNLKVSEEFGMYYARLPLKKAPHIVHGNALRLDWNEVVPAWRLSYLLGNPPFVGSKFLNDEQRKEVEAVFSGAKGSGVLDYVACWYRKAAAYMGQESPLARMRERAGGEGVETKRFSADYIPHSPAPLPEYLKFFARNMRKEQTDAEQLIWSLLRSRSLRGAKFRRQHPIGRFILDFYCVEHKLAVELDGAHHAGQKEYDSSRDEWLEEQGIKVLRFWNNQVLTEPEAVLEEIYNQLPETPSSPTLLPPAGEGSKIRAAFVSTNSITQGEQVGILWPDLFRRGVRIHFAHRTFQWNSEARGKAAVHCVIIGFHLLSPASGRGVGGEGEPEKWLFDYDNPKSEPHAIKASNINPYLVDGPDVTLQSRSTPICEVPAIGIGNKPIDGGNYLFTTEEKADFMLKEPAAAKWFRRWLGSDEFINGYERWCLWLGDCPPEELRRMPEALKRVEAVRRVRLASKSAPTRKIADTPTRFHVENMPEGNFLVIPEVSSERRNFIPIGFEQPYTLCSNLVKIVPNATLYHFGILSSTMHNAWMRAVCGRLESRYRYSAGIVYNNFPWPEIPSPPALLPPAGEGSNLNPRPRAGEGGAERRVRENIEAAAQGVLDARAKYMHPSPPSPHPFSQREKGNVSPLPLGEGGQRPGEGRGAGGEGATLADLYDPLTMPPELVKAHQQLDRAVDAAYGRTSFATEAERVAFLFERYQQLTAPLAAAAKPVSKGRKQP